MHFGFEALTLRADMLAFLQVKDTAAEDSRLLANPDSRYRSAIWNQANLCAFDIPGTWLKLEQSKKPVRMLAPSRLLKNYS
jgi:hypothetical protein